MRLAGRERKILATGSSRPPKGGIVQSLFNSGVVERSKESIAKVRQRKDYKALLAAGEVSGDPGVRDQPGPSRAVQVESDSGSDFEMDVDGSPDSDIQSVSFHSAIGSSSSGSDFEYGGLVEPQGGGGETSFEGPQASERMNVDESSVREQSMTVREEGPLSKVEELIFRELRTDLLGLERESCAAQLSASPGTLVGEHFAAFTSKYPVGRWRPRPRPVRVIPAGRNRKRRYLYRATQALYSKDRSACCRTVVTGDWRKAESPAMALEDIEPFWRNIFESESTPDSRTPEPIRDEVEWVVGPITSDEVQAAIKACSSSTAPGVDGYRLENLKVIPVDELTAMFNLWLLAARLPEALNEARTTLIPKEAGTTDPAKFRPITVTSILTRLYHRVLASRLDRGCPVNQRQKAFRRVDGISENVFLLRYLIAKATDSKRPRSLYLIFLDVRKAFDSVSFESLFLALGRVGVPKHLINYLRNVYGARFTRVYSGANASAPIRPKKGVSQGDPTSGTLFNMVIDWILTELDPTIGFPLAEGVRELSDLLSFLAFADDLVLAASTQFELQQQVGRCVGALQKCGLEINAAKCSVLAIKVDGHKRQWCCDSSAEIRIGDVLVPTIKMTDLITESRYKYLGIQFGAKGTFLNVETRLVRELDQTSRAPLRPEQRMFVLRQNIIPALNHQLVLARTTSSNLRFLDRKIRSKVREWCHLPHDTPLGYFHANPKDGGLGIVCLRYAIPAMKKRRLGNLMSSEDNLVQTMIGSEWFRNITKRWVNPDMMKVTPVGETQLEGGMLEFPMNLNKAESDRGWQSALCVGSIDGKGLRSVAASWKTQSWVTSGDGLVTGKRYCGVIALRGGLLPCRARSTRGEQRAGLPNHCDCCGPSRVESLHHILQECPRTHGPRSRRHNEVCKLLTHQLRRKGWKVQVEPRIPCDGSFVKPDIIAARLDPELGVKAIVVDVTICSDRYGAADEAHHEKVRKYRDAGGDMPVVSDWVRSWAREEFGPTFACEPEFSACSLSWRGIFSSDSYKDLRALKLSARELTLLSIRTLEWGAWTHRFFSRSTARIRRRQRRWQP